MVRGEPPQAMPASPPCEIRQLGPADLGAFRALLDVFGEAFGEPAVFGFA
jgi:hypothetical protein